MSCVLLVLLGCFDPNARPKRGDTDTGVADTGGPPDSEESGDGTDTTPDSDTGEVVESGDTSDTSDTSEPTQDVSLLAIDPSTGSTVGGEQVTISGSGFDETATVFLGGGAATVVSVEPAQLLVVTPASAAAGVVDVRVVAAAGEAVLAGGYTYVAPCTGVSASPTSVTFTCRTDATATITLTGCATGNVGVDEIYADSDGNPYGVRWSGVPSSVDGTGTATLAWDGTVRMVSLSLTARLTTDQGAVSLAVACGG